MIKFGSTRILLLIGLLLLALVVVACSPAEETEPTQAPAAEEQQDDAAEEAEDADADDADADTEAEEASDEASDEAEADEEAAPPAESAAGITELPDGCMVVVLDDGSGRSFVNIGRTQPDVDAPTSRSYRVGDAYEVAQIVENEDGLWYELRQNNRTQGFVFASQVGLGEGCE